MRRIRDHGARTGMVEHSSKEQKDGIRACGGHAGSSSSCQKIWRRAIARKMSKKNPCMRSTRCCRLINTIRFKKSSSKRVFRVERNEYPLNRFPLPSHTHPKGIMFAKLIADYPDAITRSEAVVELRQAMKI